MPSLAERLGDGEAASDPAAVGRCLRAAESLGAEHSQNFSARQASTQQPAALAAGSQTSAPAAAGTAHRGRSHDESLCNKKHTMCAVAVQRLTQLSQHDIKTRECVFEVVENVIFLFSK